MDALPGTRGPNTASLTLAVLLAAFVLGCEGRATGSGSADTPAPAGEPAQARTEAVLPGTEGSPGRTGAPGSSAVDPTTPPGASHPAQGTRPGSAGPPGSAGQLERPEPRERNFQSRALEFGEWYGELSALVSPAKDGWPTEVIAQVAERDVERCLGAALEGDFEAWSPILADGFRGGAGLRPDETQDRASDGTLRVRWGDPTAAGEVSGAEWPAAVERLVAPLVGSTASEVEVWVTSVLELEDQRFECTMSLRVVVEQGEASQQLNLLWDTVWRLDPERRRVLLERLAPQRFEEVAYRSTPFAELTQAVVADRGYFARDLHQGAVEWEGRYDRLVGSASVYLGMQGVAVGDLDGDGLEDMYVAQQGGVPNRLFMHQPDGSIRDRARRGRVDFLEDTAGVLIVDLDGDGYRDIAMGMGANLLLSYNDGTGIFSGRVVLNGPGNEQVYSLCAGDPDGDGDLDLYATRYVAGGVSRGLPTPYHDAENGATNLYWRNDGDRRYSIATEEVGLDQNNTRFSLSAIWEDVDRDGDLDLYVANDFGRNNLYRNDGGHFTDIAGEVGADDMAAGMGVTCADVELDGDLDFYVSNMFTAAGSRIAGHPGFQAARGLDARGGYMHHTQGNSLLLNSAGRFDDVAPRSRSGPGGWAWGAMFMDFENDGLPDVVVPNGFLTNRRPEDLESFFWRRVVNASPTSLPTTEAYRNAWLTISNLGQIEGYSWNGREANYAYRNLGGGTFADVSGASGLGYRDDGRVACVVDWDMDGRLDLWLKNRTAPTLRFLRNVHGSPGHWVALELVGTGANTEAVGALVTVEAGTDGDGNPRRLLQRSYAGQGYLGSSSRRLHFGLAGFSGPVQVEVLWPDGTRSTHADLAADALWQVRQGEPGARELPRVGERLEALPARRLPERLPEHPERWIDANGARITRTPLLDRLPLSRLELPSFDGQAPRIEDLAGKAVLLLLWGSWNERSVETLGTLSEGLAGSDVVLWPLSMDAVRDEPWVLGVLERIAPTRRGGRLDARLQLLFEMVIFEVLGPFDDQPLPFGMLLDAEGSLSLVYVGELDAAQVVEDARLANEGLGLPEARWPVALTGGRWALGRGPARALENLRKFLRKQGFRDVSSELRREQAQRAEDG